MELARRACEKVRRPRRALHALRDPDGGVLHADSGKDHQSSQGPGRVLMAKTTRVVMPQLGESVHEGTISKWLVQVGDRVVEFEPMLEVDTDKVNAEVPAPVTGILREILAKEGETVQAGAEIAVVELGSDGAEAPSSPPSGETGEEEAPAVAPKQAPSPAVAVPSRPSGKKVEEEAPAVAVPSPPSGGRVRERGEEDAPAPQAATLPSGGR